MYDVVVSCGWLLGLLRCSHSQQEAAATGMSMDLALASQSTVCQMVCH
jgi:hypothetical protein